jgi:phosphoenolpyruvate carboxykinase (GTP)
VTTEQVLAVDPAEWREEVPQIQEWFETIGTDKVPAMLMTELDGLKARLGDG